MVVGLLLILSCAMIHLLEQKVWKIQDERGDSEINPRMARTA
jgi:hypothetical protein